MKRPRVDRKTERMDPRIPGDYCYSRMRPQWVENRQEGRKQRPAIKRECNLALGVPSLDWLPDDEEV